MQSNRRAFLKQLSAVSATSVVGGLPLTGHAATETFPSKSVRLVSPYSAGGTADILARALADGMGRDLGQQILVENMGGASGSIGGLAVARAPADGYTIYLGGLGINVINPMLPDGQGQQFKPREQLAPLSLVASYQQIIVAGTGTSVSTLAELVAAAKQPKGLTYGTSGVTTSNYLGTEILKHQAGFNLIHVPYKGEAPTLQDLIGGTLELANISVSFAMPHIKAGKIKPIVTMYPTRVKELPDIPSVAETYPGAAVDPWFGLYTTAGTPPAVIARLNAAARAALGNKEIVERLEARGFVVRSSPSAADFSRFMQAEAKSWESRLKKAGLIKG